MDIDIKVPAEVRKSVASYGATKWKRQVPGGLIVLETRRQGTRLVTVLVGVAAVEVEVREAFAA